MQSFDLNPSNSHIYFSFFPVLPPASFLLSNNPCFCSRPCPGTTAFLTLSPCHYVPVIYIGQTPWVFLFPKILVLCCRQQTLSFQCPSPSLHPSLPQQSYNVMLCPSSCCSGAKTAAVQMFVCGPQHPLLQLHRLWWQRPPILWPEPPCHLRTLLEYDVDWLNKCDDRKTSKEDEQKGKHCCLST